MQGDSIDELEAAFAALGPLIKEWRSSVASEFDPEMRPGTWMVLRTVLHHGRSQGEPLTVSDIIAETQIDKSVVSRHLRDLKEYGFVTLRRSEADARVFVVEPTDAAREREAAIKRAARSRYRRLFGDWEERDISELARLLNRLSQSTHRLR
ncbi:MarR family winged helix-turn-helix transcriptional regulator [Microbacterium sp.]|uniref:MarR family winged helix-turn-helix transcriptional regulator n=1 Tax=Microbacterium sp. TaxID=51671 RepID=UPI002810ED0D|nr:MarR family winged helix-turn-helix transcriptional regulator [Microbacterium sp.]